jgi:hypothetical protein
MAALSGQNILQGAMMGFIAGAMFGVAGGHFWQTVAVGALVGATSSMMYGGNILQGAIIGAAGAAIGYGVGQWGGTPASQGGLGLHHFGQGVLAVMSGGVVGGLSSVAMGGDFWQGFTQGAASAGLSFAANAVAVQMEGQVHDPTTTTVEKQRDPTTGATTTTYQQTRVFYRSGQRIELTEYIKVTDLNGEVTGTESGFSAKYLGNDGSASVSGKSIGHESSDVAREVRQMKPLRMVVEEGGVTVGSNVGAAGRLIELERFGFGLMSISAQAGVGNSQFSRVAARMDFFGEVAKAGGFGGVSKVLGGFGSGVDVARSYASIQAAEATERALVRYSQTGQTVQFQ